MKVITLTNNKGGVAKTTSVYNIGAALGEMGYKVGLIDTEHQANLTARFDREILETQKDIATLVRTKTELEFNDFTPTQLKNVWIIPNLGDFKDHAFEKFKGLEQYVVLKKLIRQIKGFDYILIDTPPGMGKVTENAIIAADFLIIPINYDDDSIDGIEIVNFNLNLFNEHNFTKNTKVLGVLPTLVIKNAKINEIMKERLAKQFPNLNILKNEIPRSTYYVEARTLKEPIFIYKPDKIEYKLLAKEIINKINSYA